jgi:hypothetical protein
MDRKNSKISSSSSQSFKSSSKSKAQTEDERIVEIISLFSKHFEQQTLSPKITSTFFALIEPR